MAEPETHNLTAVLCGPIHGRAGFQEAFEDARAQLEGAGYTAYTPIDAAPVEANLETTAGSVAPYSEPWCSAIRKCLHQVLDADAVFFLPGWHTSVGASLEYQVAKACGIEIFMYDAWLGKQVA